MSLILKAARLARKAHGGQTRKHNGLPYDAHVSRVAGRVATHDIACEESVAAAFLHDVKEDTSYTFDDILTELHDERAEDVLDLVRELTNPSKGSRLSRTERKCMDRDHLSNVSYEAKVIKLIDRCDNLMEILSNWTRLTIDEKNFVQLYVEESILLAKVIGHADERLEEELMMYAHQLRKLVRQEVSHRRTSPDSIETAS